MVSSAGTGILSVPTAPVEESGLVEAVFSPVRAPTVKAGLFHPGRISLGRAVKREFPRAEKKAVLIRKRGRRHDPAFGLGHGAPFLSVPATQTGMASRVMSLPPVTARLPSAKGRSLSSDMVAVSAPASEVEAVAQPRAARLIQPALSTVLPEASVVP